MTAVPEINKYFEMPGATERRVVSDAVAFFLFFFLYRFPCCSRFTPFMWGNLVFDEICEGICVPSSLTGQTAC